MIDAMAELGVMSVGGYYDLNSSTQGAAADHGIGLLTEAVNGLPATTAEITVADLGCAQGRNSLGPLRAAVVALRAGRSTPIRVVHTDLPGNDWTTLFDTVEHDPRSYLVGTDDVFPSAVGRSFYGRLFPGDTVALGWCSSALHWLSRSPGPIADHFFVQSSTDPNARSAYRARSAADLSSFLEHRAAELIVGGSVVVVDVLMGDDGRMGSENLFDCLESALRAARDRAAITPAEYAAIAYPTWFRSLAEWRAPFLSGFTASGGQVLALDALSPASLADPFRAGIASPTYGPRQAGFLAGFLRPSFATGLAGRTDAQARELLDEIFADAARRITALARTDPGAISPDYRLVVGRITRTA